MRVLKRHMELFCVSDEARGGAVFFSLYFFIKSKATRDDLLNDAFRSSPQVDETI